MRQPECAPKAGRQKAALNCVMELLLHVDLASSPSRSIYSNTRSLTPSHCDPNTGTSWPKLCICCYLVLQIRAAACSGNLQHTNERSGLCICQISFGMCRFPLHASRAAASHAMLARRRARACCMLSLSLHAEEIDANVTPCHPRTVHASACRAARAIISRSPHRRLTAFIYA